MNKRTMIESNNEGDICIVKHILLMGIIYPISIICLGPNLHLSRSVS